jgi:hypothetical protein
MSSVWLTGRLVPDHKTIANFRKDNGRAIRQVVVEAVQRRLDENPEKMRQRRETVEHPFGTQGPDGRGTLSAADAAAGRLGMALHALA